VRQGQTVRIHFKNELPEQSIVHWHGLHVPDAADGHPRLAIEPGETYTYTFKVKDRAGTYWYHPHPHGRTGPQVYAGLAGLFIIHDTEEDMLALPQGEFDLALVIQDRLFTTENQLYYGGNRMTQMEGFLGNEILVNGFPEAQYELKAGVYRLRLLNGSNSRIYKIAWKDGRPLTIIGTDGGLLERPIEKDSIILAPAQRIELWADFSIDEPGTLRELVSLPHAAPGGGETLSLLTIEINGASGQAYQPPERLSSIQWEDPNQASNSNNPRKFTLAFGRGMQFTLNGRTFEMEKVAESEKVTLGDLEIWEFENFQGGMGMMTMSIPHPMHIHGLQFQIIERDLSGVDQYVWGDMIENSFDAGWHDTVLVYPGEKVRLLMRFADFSGLYLYHCHNLEHEDMGMMRNFQVEA
jgi:FtsP/CotA-like multicopper oxidase with cupredoxin domain